MRKFLLLATIFVAGLLAGCGGSSSNNGSGGVSLFVTDNLNAGYDHVWVTITMVELKKQDGTFVTAYNNATGQTVDLRSLNDGSPIFSLLNFENVPAATYTAARVTMMKSLTLFTTGATTGTVTNFISAYDSGAQSRIEFALNTPKVVAGATNLVIDFDLSQWTVNGSGVTVVVKEGSESGLDNPNRHEKDDYRGVVSGLSGTSPAFTFSLNLNHGGTIQVKTDATTGIYASDGSNPTLANGQTVTVRGVFSTTDSALIASSVRIKVGSSDNDSAHASGVASNLNSGASTFDITVHEAEGFVPSDSTVHIALSPTAKLFSGHCIVFATPTDFFTALGAIVNPRFEVQGTYDSGTNTLTATKVKIENGQGSEDGVEVRGKVAMTPALDVANGTFSVVVSSWSGISLTMGATVPIATTVNTTYKIVGNASDKAGFFAGLTGGTTVVEVEGTYDGTTITASKLKIDQ